MRHVLKKSGTRFDLYDLKALALLSIVLIVLSAIAMALYNHTIVRLGILFIACLVIGLNNKKILGTFREIRNR